MSRRRFDDSQLVAETLPLAQLVLRLANQSRLFVVRGHVTCASENEVAQTDDNFSWQGVFLPRTKFQC